MSDLEEFGQECKEVARKMRRIPSELRRALASEVKDEVATPLASKIAASTSGPWASELASAVKARKLTDPTIVIGGSKKLVSHGASARDLVFGTEFGGGKRITAVPRNEKHRGYRRRSTNQFVPDHPFVYSTIAKNGEWIMDRFAEIVIRVLEKGVNDG